MLMARSAGLPPEFVSLPGTMSEITKAAEIVVAGDRTLEEVIDAISQRESLNEAERNAARMNLARLMRLTLNFMTEIELDESPNRSLPEMCVPWFRYVHLTNKKRCRSATFFRKSVRAPESGRVSGSVSKMCASYKAVNHRYKSKSSITAHTYLIGLAVTHMLQ